MILPLAGYKEHVVQVMNMRLEQLDDDLPQLALMLHPSFRAMIKRDYVATLIKKVRLQRAGTRHTGTGTRNGVRSKGVRTCAAAAS
jgi:hypothetical protein